MTCGWRRAVATRRGRDESRGRRRRRFGRNDSRRAAASSPRLRTPAPRRVARLLDERDDLVGPDASLELVERQAPVAVRVEEVEDGLRAADVDGVRVR